MVGGIVGEDTLLSSGNYLSPEVMGNNFYPPGWTPDDPIGSVRPCPSIADFSLRAIMTDTLHPQAVWTMPRTPLNIQLVNRSHAWHVDSLANTIIYDLTITNIGVDTIREMYTGFFFDTDVGGPLNYSTYIDDLSGSIRSRGIGYAIDNDGDPDIHGNFVDSSTTKVFAFKFLETSFEATDTTFNWWVGASGPWSTSFGPRQRGTDDDPFREFADGGLGSPGDVNDAYYLLSHNEWDYDQVLTGIIQPYDPTWLFPDPTTNPSPSQIADGDDVKFIMSIGSFDLYPDSSVRILYATFSGDSLISRTDLPLIAQVVPELFSSALNFDDLLYTADISDSLARRLIDPSCPTTGLSVTNQYTDSATLTWDPWVFPEVDGYNVYLWEVPPESLYFPQLVPPWLKPTTLERIASLDLETKFRPEALDPTRAYLMNVAHRSGVKTGDPSDPVIVRTFKHPPAPIVERAYVFSVEDNPALLSWSAPPDVAVQYYNLYRFADSLDLAHAYFPFFDNGVQRGAITPRDSVYVDGRWHYYYAMEPYQQLSAESNRFFEHDPNDGYQYSITAVDIDGFESQFSQSIILEKVPPRDRGILVLTFSQVGDNYVTFDTVKAFYDSILAGYDYDIINFQASLPDLDCIYGTENCLGWKRLHQYELVIVDDGLQDRVISPLYEDRSGAFDRYLTSGGKLAHFGSMRHMNGFTNMTLPAYYPPGHQFFERFFDVDSIFYVGLAHFRRTQATQPYIDSLFGFGYARPVDPKYPDLSYDTLRYPFTSGLLSFWPANTPPSVATFMPGSEAEVIYRYGSKYPGTSMNHDQPVGIKTRAGSATTWLFGFHLWSMEHNSARDLIEQFGIAINDENCCVGMSGNVDASAENQTDIADVQRLIMYLFNNEALACPEAGNIDGDPDGTVSISDLLLLIDHLFINLPSVAPCP